MIKVRSTFGLALVTAISVSATMYALGLFSATPASASGWFSTVTVTPTTARSIAQYTIFVTGAQVRTNDVEVGEKITVKFNSSTEVPSAIVASSIQLQADIVGGAGVPNQSVPASAVTVSGREIIITVPDMDPGTPGENNIPTFASVTITIAQSAGIQNPDLAGFYQITVKSDGDPIAKTSESYEITSSAFSCGAVTEIPKSECEALVALYDNTDGPGWLTSIGWLDSTTPCSWFQVRCDGGHVTQIGLSVNRLNGAIPSELGDLAGLQVFNLCCNDLNGSIPPELGGLTSLRYFNLVSNQLSGVIPPELGALVNLEFLDLFDNLLTGAIPPELSNLASLQELDLCCNQLSGDIPPELGNLASLQELNLGLNQLSGTIPAEFSGLSSLRNLRLGNNQLSGAIPSELGGLTNLQRLFVNQNPMAGPLPGSLRDLDLSHFWFDETDLCEPSDTAFQAWLDNIPNLAGTGVLCGSSPNILVTSTSDTIASDGFCTLREAIINANNDDQSGSTDCPAGNLADSISLPAGTYNLTLAGADDDAAATGDLDVTDDLTINGADTATTIIDGNALDRVFHIHSGVNVEMAGLTMRNGRIGSAGGGGIFNDGGLLALADTEVRDNASTEGSGAGGIYNIGELTLTRSTVSGNTAGFGGGGITNAGVLTIANSTVSNNTVPVDGGLGHGGGIHNFGQLTMTNSTLSGNTAIAGGAIFNFDGPVDLVNSTITGNTTQSIFSAALWGGSAIALLNMIVADNTSGGDCAGIITSRGHNLDSDDTCGLTHPDDLPGVNPVLGPLQGNGGPTFTHSLLPGSPAIDAGDDSVLAAPLSLTTDQRGGPRRWLNHVDIGAFEVSGGQVIPHVFIGTARIDGVLVPDGTQVESQIDGVAVSSTATNGGSYVLLVEGFRGFAGRVVGFTVGGFTVDQTAAWVQGGGDVLDLTAFSGDGFSCGSVTEIPQIECHALTALYDSTGGPGWDSNAGWLESAMPCSWYGVVCNGGHVAGLDLSGNQLIGVIPPKLGSLENLKYLWLAFNQLSGGIPPELSDLTGLQRLYLHVNELSGTIPPELGGLGNLELLSLRDNHLSGEIPLELGDLANLQFLYLDTNDLGGAIPPELGGLANLVKFSLNSNQLSGAIPSELGGLARLIWLTVNNNQLTGALPDSLTDLGQLELFFFQATDLCEPPDPAFQEWLESIPNLSRTGVMCSQKILWVPVKYQGEDDPITLVEMEARLSSVLSYFDDQSNGQARLEFQRATPASAGWIQLDRSFDNYDDNPKDGTIEILRTNCDLDSQLYEAGDITADVVYFLNNELGSDFLSGFQGLYIVQSRNELRSHVCQGGPSSLGSSVPVALVAPGDGFSLHAHEIGHLAFGWNDHYDGLKYWGLMGWGGGIQSGAFSPIAPVTAFHREQRGWIDIKEMSLDVLEYMPFLYEPSICCYFGKYIVGRQDTWLIFEARLPYDDLETPKDLAKLDIEEGVQGVNVYKIENPTDPGTVKISRMHASDLFSVPCIPISGSKRPTLSGSNLFFCDSSVGVNAFLIIDQGKLFIKLTKRTNIGKLLRLSDIRLPTGELIGIPTDTDTAPDIDLIFITPAGLRIGPGSEGSDYEFGIPSAGGSGDIPGGGEEWIELPAIQSGTVTLDHSDLETWLQKTGLEDFTNLEFSATLEVIRFDSQGTEISHDQIPITQSLDQPSIEIAIAPTLCGDVHPVGGGDGDDDIQDALRKLKIAVGLIIPTQREMIAGDVHPANESGPDGDGDIDVLDALRDLKAAVGLVEITSCGGP